MASGFPGGGGPDLYAGIGGRSIPTTMNSNSQYPSSQSPYRNQLSQIFLDPAMSSHQHQIPLNRTPSNLTAQQQLQEHLFRKRTLADYQAQQQQQAAALNGLLNLRSVKPRTMVYQQLQQLQQHQSYSSPVSTLSPVEFPANSSGNILPPELASNSPLLSQRYNLPLLQQLRYQNHQHLQQPNLSTVLSRNPTLPKLPSISNVLQETHDNNNVGGGVVLEQDSENTKMMDRLQELEKQLLDDKELEADAVSVITSTTNSEWSETIQNLIAPTSTLSSNTVSPSPTSSSSSVTTPAQPICSKQTVTEAASAICEGKFDVASEILTRVSKVSNLGGNSEQRLMEYMFSALKSRLNSAENPPPGAELYSKEHADSIQLLYEISPCFKLGFMAANLAILEATQEVDGFHVVDFHIGQGGHYMNLLHGLSSRQQGKPPIGLKITAVAGTGGDEEKERLKMVGDMLSQVAERVGGACLEFNVVTCNKLGDLTRESLGCAADEALVVNFAFKLYRMPDESVSTENPRDELLRRVKALGPRLVTLVEQEMNSNTAPFMVRVNEACSYYGALFDSIESTTVDNSDRVKVEEALSRKLANSIACEGGERVERCEVFGKWRARMRMAGFALNPLSQNVAETMKTRLSSANRANPGFSVKEENGGICLGWLGKTLTVASAWC